MTGSEEKARNDYFGPVCRRISRAVAGTRRQCHSTEKQVLWPKNGHIVNYPTTRPRPARRACPSVPRAASASGPLATSADSPRASRASRAVRGATSNAAAHARGSLKKAFGKVRFYGHAAVPADLIDEARGGREKGTGERILMPQHGAKYPKGYAHCTKSYSLIWN